MRRLGGEVGLGLVWLQAAQCGELRHARRGFHDGVCALLAKVILEQTVNKENTPTRQWLVSNTVHMASGSADGVNHSQHPQSVAWRQRLEGWYEFGSRDSKRQI